MELTREEKKTESQKDLRNILPKKKRNLVRSNTKYYTCPLCGKIDPTEQSIIQLGQEIIIMNCGMCKTHMVIAIVNEGGILH